MPVQYLCGEFLHPVPDGDTGDEKLTVQHGEAIFNIHYFKIKIV
jgi:hypothetical protein